MHSQEWTSVNELLASFVGFGQLAVLDKERSSKINALLVLFSHPGQVASRQIALIWVNPSRTGSIEPFFTPNNHHTVPRPAAPSKPT